MKKEELFETFGNLNDELIKRSEQGGNSKQKRNYRMNRFVKWGSLAASFVVIISAGFFFFGNKDSEPDTIEPNGIIADNDNNHDEIVEKYISIDTLLASNDNLSTEQSLKDCTIQVSQYKAVYEAVASVSSEQLEQSIGKVIDAGNNGYYVSGHTDMQYIIKDNAGTGTYYLWRFMYFDSEDYPYNDVLSMIYDINSADDIEKIVSNPATMDNSDEGKALQQEIGIINIDTKDQVEKFYNIISKLICYGNNRWDMIGLEEPSSINQVEAGRYLKIVTSQGMEIDTLKYTGITGVFYEYGGVAYSPLDDETKIYMDDLLEIESIDKTVIEKEDGSERNQTTNEGANAPIDEANYNDAKTYSNDIVDLQNRISQEMINGELPFVSSSAIYENPDRLHVVVTTDDDVLLNKLRAFDTTETLLEIEYQENGGVNLE